MSFDLRPYQTEALRSIALAQRAGIQRQFVVLPTGTGKTVCFANLHTALENPYPMLVIAHREELLDQAAQKIKQSNPELSLSFEQGQNHAERTDVVVASVATLGRADGRRIQKFERHYFNTVIVDEAHHAAAPTYRRILDYFDSALRIGFTATPQRTDNARLTDVFEEVVFYRSIVDMIKEGWLSPLVGYRLNSSVDIRNVRLVHGDYSERELSAAVNTDARNVLLVDAYRQFLSGRQVIIFCVDVAHAKSVASFFNASGISSDYVVGEMDSQRRREVLQDFSDRKINVITNCMVLTEGFDEPQVSGIIMARPTQSQLLYTQCVGRGTRLHDSKSECIIVDIADVTKGRTPVGLPSLMGLPSDFLLEGKRVDEVAEQYEKLAQKAPGEVVNVRSLADIDLAWQKIDLFRMPTPDPAVLMFSSFIWVAINDSHWSLGLGDQGSVHINSDPLGRFNISIHGIETHSIAISQDLSEAFSIADAWVKENASEKISLLYSQAGWRNDIATDKQKRALRKFGVPVTEDMTKGHASYILDKLYADNPRPAWLQNKIANQNNKF